MKLQENCSYEELKNQALLAANENLLLRNEINNLKEQLTWLKKQIFGKKSEKIISDLNNDQLVFEGFEEQKPEEKINHGPSHTRRSSKKGSDTIALPSDLPVKRIVIDIPEKEKMCSITKKPMVKIGEEISFKLAHESGSYYLKEIVRPKYALPNNDGIKTALMPDSIIPKCRADESLLADILTKKYASYLPLYRIHEEFLRDNIRISAKLMSTWVIKIGNALKPLYNEMLKSVLKSDNVFIDETPVNLQDTPKVKQAYIWVMVGGKHKNPFYRVYNFRMDRKHIHAEELLHGYTGTLHSDKYGAYQSLAIKKQFTWCPCFSHIRRKFIESETDPDFTKLIIRKIRYLFMLERVAWNRTEDERLLIRREKEIPIIDQLIELVKNKLHDRHILPKSKLKEALGYFYSLVPYLKNYTKHPWAHIDNNTAERAVRPIAIGRKNWLFVGSKNAGEAQAVIMSLVQTCRALNINPRIYLEDIMRRIMGHNSQKLHELLPDVWALSANR
jgi:transposase